MELVPDLIRATDRVETPFLLMNLSVVRQNYRRLKELLPQARVHYAVKANAHPRVIQALAEEGAWFDCASVAEIAKVLKHAPTDRVCFGNTIKKAADIEWAHRQGIFRFTADAPLEVEKIARHAPGSQVKIRLAVPGRDEESMRFSEKFGADVEGCYDLLQLVQDAGLVPLGVTFLVGSQCRSRFMWADAIGRASEIFDRNLNKGVRPSVLNLGGGLPVRYRSVIPSVETYTENIQHSLERYFPADEMPEIEIEPGRYMVAEAGILVSSVILRKSHVNAEWLYLDVGVYQGLQETLLGTEYEMVAPGASGAPQEFQLAGPTCDSYDVINPRVPLPAGIGIGDRVYALKAGAYTTECTTEFNGLASPHIVFLDELSEGSPEKVRKIIYGYDAPPIQDCFSSPVPEQVSLELLQACNLHCEYCYLGPAESRVKGVIELTDAKQILSGVGEAGVSSLHLFGGEPTLYPHLLELIDYAKEVGIPDVGVQTNGVCQDEALLSDLANRADWVHVTFRGGDSDTFDKHAGLSGSYTTAMRTLELLSSGSTYLGLEFDCCPDNWHQVEPLVEHVISERGLDVREIWLHRIAPRGCATELNLHADLEVFRGVLEQCARIEEKHGILAKVEDSLPLCLVDEALRPFILPCKGGFVLVFVDPNGNVRRCACSKHVAGNLLNQSLQSIWRDSPLLKSFRALGWLPDPCKRCAALDRCRGGCSVSCPSKEDHGADVFSDHFTPIGEAR